MLALGEGLLELQRLEGRVSGDLELDSNLRDRGSEEIIAFVDLGLKKLVMLCCSLGGKTFNPDGLTGLGKGA